jgi:hypothetical protein
VEALEGAHEAVEVADHPVVVLEVVHMLLAVVAAPVPATPFVVEALRSAGSQLCLARAQQFPARIKVSIS